MQAEFSSDPSDVETLDDVLYTFGDDPEEGTITEIDEDDQLVRISGPHGQSDVVGFDELRQGMVVPKDEALEPAWVDEYEQAAERHRELSGGDDGYWDCYEEAQEALPFDVEDTVGYEGETYTVSAFDPARGDASVELADPLESADTRWVEPTAVDPSAEPTTAGLDQPNTPTIPDEVESYATAPARRARPSSSGGPWPGQAYSKSSTRSRSARMLSRFSPAS
jgi:hypothetical protein